MRNEAPEGVRRRAWGDKIASRLREGAAGGEGELQRLRGEARWI